MMFVLLGIMTFRIKIVNIFSSHLLLRKALCHNAALPNLHRPNVVITGIRSKSNRVAVL